MGCAIEGKVCFALCVCVCACVYAEGYKKGSRRGPGVWVIFCVHQTFWYIYLDNQGSTALIHRRGKLTVLTDITYVVMRGSVTSHTLQILSDCCWSCLSVCAFSFALSFPGWPACCNSWGFFCQQWCWSSPAAFWGNREGESLYCFCCQVPLSWRIVLAKWPQIPSV